MLPPKFLSLLSLNLASAAENKCRLFAKEENRGEEVARRNLREADKKSPL